MSQVRCHNFSISLDGFGTGDGITFDTPFGHGGERLHEWYVATRFWRSMVGETGGTAGVDHSFAERIELGFGAEIMGRGKFGPQTGPWADVATDVRMTIHPHPTLSETIMESAEVFFGQATHVYRPRKKA